MGRWIIGITLLVMAAHASADFVWRPAHRAQADEPQAKQVVPAVLPEPELLPCAPGVRREIGLSPAHPSLTRASDHPVDVASALRRIVPEGWVIRAELSTPAPNRKVRWSGGRTWPDAVEDIAREGGVCLTVDYPAQAITIEPLAAGRPAESEGALEVGAPVAVAVAVPPRQSSPAAAGAPTSRAAAAPPPPPPPPPKLVPAEPEPEAVVVPPAAPVPARVASDATPPDEPVAVIAPVTPSYRLKPGETVRETLARWCQDSHWTLVWDSSLDYPVDVAHVFPQGTTLRQAIERVLSAYWGQANPLVAKIYKNRVVQIVPGHD